MKHLPLVIQQQILLMSVPNPQKVSQHAIPRARQNVVLHYHRVDALLRPPSFHYQLLYLVRTRVLQHLLVK